MPVAETINQPRNDLPEDGRDRAGGAEAQPEDLITTLNQQTQAASLTTLIDVLGIPTDTIAQPVGRGPTTSHTTQTVGPSDEDDY